VGVLRIERRAGWAVLTLDRPDKRNALSIELRDAVSDALDELAADAGISAVAVTGAGDDFSAGWDLGEFERAGREPDLAARIWASGDRFHHTLLTFPLPLVAAVGGRALGGAFDLAVCCDVRIAATTARFAHPEFAWADVLYAPLEALVGGAVARDLLLTGRELDAAAALAVNLVSAVVAPADLAAELDATMARIAAAPRDVLRRTKAKAIRRAAIDLAPSLEL
jgi:enoyl-CoA hydratase/carnithine racemase